MARKIVARGANNWKPSRATKAMRARLHSGIGLFRRALEQDAKEAAARGAGLPKDWRSRVFKGKVSQGGSKEE